MTSNDSPAVSIVLPTYNRASFLREAIRTLLRQTYETFELIVVDDGSTDDTTGVIEAMDDRRLRYTRHGSNRGASAARNTGIRMARGEYVAFQDSDDRWKPGKLEKQVQLMDESDPDVGLVYTGLEVGNGGPREAAVLKPQKRGDVYRDQLWRDWIVGTPTWLVRRRCFEKVGTFDEDLPARQDYEMSLRLARRYRFDYVDEVLVTMNAEAPGRITEDPANRIKAHERLLTKLRRDHLGECPWMTRRRILASQHFALARYCQRRGDSASARKFFAKALKMNPVHLKSLAGYVLAACGLDVGEWYYSLRLHQQS